MDFSQPYANIGSQWALRTSLDQELAALEKLGAHGSAAEVPWVMGGSSGSGGGGGGIGGGGGSGGGTGGGGATTPPGGTATTPPSPPPYDWVTGWGKHDVRQPGQWISGNWVDPLYGDTPMFGGGIYDELYNASKRPLQGSSSGSSTIGNQYVPKPGGTATTPPSPGMIWGVKPGPVAGEGIPQDIGWYDPKAPYAI